MCKYEYSMQSIRMSYRLLILYFRYLKERLIKQQATIEQLRYDLRALRDEHSQFVRHQSARLDLVMK